MSREFAGFEDHDSLGKLEVDKEYIYDSYAVKIRNAEQSLIVKSFVDLSEDEADQLVSHLTSLGVREPGEIRKGDLVADARNENDLQLVIVKESGNAGEVCIDDGETVAEYTGCDEDETTFECANVDGWENVEEKSVEKRLELVEKFTNRTYHYPESLLDVVSRGSVVAGDDDG